MRERLERVVAHQQLRPGLLVVIRDCRRCKSSHRHLLLRYAGVRDYHDGLSTAWHCSPDNCPPTPWLAVDLAINEGRLFIVDLFTDDEQPARTEKQRPRQRSNAR